MGWSKKADTQGRQGCPFLDQPVLYEMTRVPHVRPIQQTRQPSVSSVAAVAGDEQMLQRYRPSLYSNTDKQTGL